MALTIVSSSNWSNYEGTSSTTTTVALSAKTFTVDAGKSWYAGVALGMTAVGTKLFTSLYGNSVTSYTGTSLTITPGGYTTDTNQPGYLCTMWGNSANQALSSTTLTIGTGIKVLLTRPNLNLVKDDPIRVVFRTTPTTFMDGLVQFYDRTTGNLIFNSVTVGGSGTQTDWQIISSGNISSWIIHPKFGDTVSVSNGVTLNIDKTNFGLPTNLSSTGTGQITIINSGSVTPTIFRISSRPINTGQGRITLQQNATLTTRGNWIYLATGSGASMQYQFPTGSNTWDEMSAPTMIDVETASGSNVFEKWNVIGSQFYGLNRYG